MAKGGGIGFLKRLWAKILPFVAQSPEMKINWLVNAIQKKKLSPEDIAPYMRLLLMEYKNYSSYSWEENQQSRVFEDFFEHLDREVLSKMIDSTELCDIPSLLKLLPDLTIDDAMLILQKNPPLYEQRPQILVDRAFQAVYDCSSEQLFEAAAKQIFRKGAAVEHFAESYKRFQEIKEDEKFLSSMYPQARK